MATYKQVSYGSQGSDVTELQKLLNKNGYSLDEDGIFGSKTQAAVQDYQKKNNLAVDGIVGNNTWGALTNASGSSSGGSTGTTAKTNTPAYEAYKPSDAVTQAEQLLQQQLANKPGAYQSAWQTQLDDTINKILNREKFSYDLNGDALYQQYKDKYVQQGKMAMMDTMGQAQAMTGGYGNSYAQMAGQQAYQGHLQNLNDVIPELYQLAYDQYNQRGQDLLNQYSILGAQEGLDYDRYRDKVSDHNADLSFAYQNWRDLVGDQQWQAQFDEAKRQYDQEWAQMYGETGESAAGTTNSIGYTGFDNGGLDASKVLAMQEALGMEGPDGKWGPKSRAAALKQWGTEDPNEAYEKYLAEMEGGSGDVRNEEIEKWVANAMANSKTSGFSLEKLISGSSFLKSDEEREYARQIGKYLAGIS